MIAARSTFIAATITPTQRIIIRAGECSHTFPCHINSMLTRRYLKCVTHPVWRIGVWCVCGVCVCECVCVCNHHAATLHLQKESSFTTDAQRTPRITPHQRAMRRFPAECFARLASQWSAASDGIIISPPILRRRLRRPPIDPRSTQWKS